VRRFARLLIVTGIGQIALVVVVVIGFVVFGPDPPVAALVPVIVIGVVISLLHLVAWVGALRALCQWGGGQRIVAAWDRTIWLVPIAWIAIAIAIALVATADAPPILIALPAGAVYWFVGHPAWWTYRFFDADLRRGTVAEVK
jgi:hypothetical protein